MQSTLVATMRVTIRALPPEYRPVRVVRSSGVTVVCVEPTAVRWQTAQALLDLLSEPELARLGQAYDQPPDGPMDRWTVTDELTLLYVPVALRLIGEPGLQGGAELERRMLEGEMEMEMACVDAERVVSPFRVR